MSVNHKAQVLIIHCIDFRFQKVIQEDIKKRGFDGKFDRISWPGASKDFEAVKSQVKLSLKLHDPDEVIIYEHVDCGAYDENDSIDTHRENALNLKDSLLTAKPQLQITTLIATFEEIKEL